jgi:hypothetical protein
MEVEMKQRCTVRSGVGENPRSEVEPGHHGPMEGGITLPRVSMVYLKGHIAK